MPLASYRASAELVLHKIREVAALGAQRPSTLRSGHRQSAKQLLSRSSISAASSPIWGSLTGSETDSTQSGRSSTPREVWAAILLLVFARTPIYGISCTGPPEDGPGRPKQYDGKIDWDDREELSRRFEEVGRLPDQPEVRVLTTTANSPHFGRDLRVVLLIGPGGEQVILAPTDRSQHAEEVVEYYRLRYQIEPVIRDAKQHAGLTHCQARTQEKLDFHLNMSITAVNLLRLRAQKAECSPRTYRREAFGPAFDRSPFL